MNRQVIESYWPHFAVIAALIILGFFVMAKAEAGGFQQDSQRCHQHDNGGTHCRFGANAGDVLEEGQDLAGGGCDNTCHWLGEPCDNWHWCYRHDGDKSAEACGAGGLVDPLSEGVDTGEALAAVEELTPRADGLDSERSLCHWHKADLCCASHQEADIDSEIDAAEQLAAVDELLDPHNGEIPELEGDDGQLIAGSCWNPCHVGKCNIGHMCRHHDRWCAQADLEGELAESENALADTTGLRPPPPPGAIGQPGEGCHHDFDGVVHCPPRGGWPGGQAHDPLAEDAQIAAGNEIPCHWHNAGSLNPRLVCNCANPNHTGGDGWQAVDIEEPGQALAAVGDAAFTDYEVQFANITAIKPCSADADDWPACNVITLELTDEYAREMQAAMPSVIDTLFAWLTLSPSAHANAWWKVEGHAPVSQGSAVYDANGVHWGYITGMDGNMIEVCYTDDYAERMKATH